MVLQTDAGCGLFYSVTWTVDHMSIPAAACVTHSVQGPQNESRGKNKGCVCCCYFFALNSQYVMHFFLSGAVPKALDHEDASNE